MKRSILVTNCYLERFGGSELVALEIAEEFYRQGWEVLLYSPVIKKPLKPYITVPCTDKIPDTSKFDVLWIHHNQLIFEDDFKKAPNQKIIFNHMSSYVSPEWPRDANYEMQLADKIFANSEETKRKLEELSLSNIELFQNPAPRNFEKVARNKEAVLLVSNHPPKELEKIVGLRLGLEYPRRLLPVHMEAAKFVICNGKTVQYALRAGIPIYLYDHFGGPGWLTPENFEKAEWFNFSGRGFGFKTSAQIEDELKIIGPVIDCPDRFKLEKVLEVLKL